MPQGLEYSGTVLCRLNLRVGASPHGGSRSAAPNPHAYTGWRTELKDHKSGGAQ